LKGGGQGLEEKYLFLVLLVGGEIHRRRDQAIKKADLLSWRNRNAIINAVAHEMDCDLAAPCAAVLQASTTNRNPGAKGGGPALEEPPKDDSVIRNHTLR